MGSALDQYGVVGHPVGHSLSPFIHGMFARETGQRISYRLYDVPPAEFHQRVRAFFAQGGRGLNVTLPHNIAAVEVAHELTPRAAYAAAVNTLAARPDGILGDNTDGAGLVRDLCDNLGVAITHRRVLIIGAGGATRGILGPLLGRGPELLVIANRTAQRAPVDKEFCSRTLRALEWALDPKATSLAQVPPPYDLGPEMNIIPCPQ